MLPTKTGTMSTYDAAFVRKDRNPVRPALDRSTERTRSRVATDDRFDSRPVTAGNPEA